MSRHLFRNSAVRRPQFYRFSARDAVLGKFAAHLARIVCGKHKPVYNPAVDCGDNVVVTNVEEVVLTGAKREQKHYFWHTGFVGHLKTRPVSRVLDETPERVLWKAVYGMLPKNRLRRLRMQRLRLFRGDEHPHSSQAVPPPPHLEFKPGKHKGRGKVESAEDLADVPGYWVEIENDESGAVVKTRVQTVNGKMPPKRTKKAGLFKKGAGKGFDHTDIKPMSEIPFLAGVEKLTNKEAKSADKEKGKKK